MSSNKDEIERLIAEVEEMTQVQRLMFIELLLRSIRDHELPFFFNRMHQAVGRVRLLTNIDLVKPTRKTPSKKR